MCKAGTKSDNASTRLYAAPACTSSWPAFAGGLLPRHSRVSASVSLAWTMPPISPSPKAPPDRSRTNLPVALTSFVGRSGELLAIRQFLTDSRLVTLVGAGGVGKTRLALRVAARGGRRPQRARSGRCLDHARPEERAPAEAHACGPRQL